ncbi:aminopeptidase N [Chelativorans sp. Marseille-P2723]|uniref:aminopeptidase N n=1 Tax=Chelativorans sp. Marseille-P2723 TaxID=2709133 RepID=UPI001570DF90|nr:aminopeptidase N [Chelativorans sp. Marseille-P2723]
MRTDTGQIFRLEDYRPSEYLIPQVDLAFRLDAHETEVTATLTVERRSGVEGARPLVLDGDGLSLDYLLIDGERADGSSYEAAHDSLTISKLPSAERFCLTIGTRLNPAANKALMGLYLSNGVFCTQCEAEGFRRITYFLDRPDILSVYRVRIEARRSEAPLLLSNGNPVESGRLEDGWHYAVWHDPFPKPSYLFALVAGDLGALHDSFTTASGRKVSLGIYVEHGKEARATYAMDALKRSMRWDEEHFGREYDLNVFNIVAVSDFNMGAMENKGLNIFNDKYVLAEPDTATDHDYANIEAIIAHEYFHNWTGNRITCRDWFQLCLKEGLTVYRDHEFSADQRSRPVKRIAEVKTLKALQFPEDQGPLAHPVRPRRYREINNFYTPTVYEKGAEVVRMIRTILGAEPFRAAMDLYFDRHDGQAVTIEDFLACFEEVSNHDLSQFALWYHQAGTPAVTVHPHYDADTSEYSLEMEQFIPSTPSETHKRPMHIPLAFGLLGPDGQDIEYEFAEGADVEGGVIHLRAKRHLVRFRGVGARPVLSINRGFSAPINLSLTMRQEDHMFLARHDQDLFSRWQSLNWLFTDELIRAAASIRAGSEPEFSAAILDYPAAIASDTSLEAAYRALALTLPAEADIAREMGSNVDPDAIAAARKSLRLAIANAASKTFMCEYSDLADHLPFSADAESAGKRALRNVLLEYLAAESSEPSLALSQFESAKNMTDRAAALSVLAHQFPDSAAAQKALKHFEKRYRDNPLVLDKWFLIQSTIPGEKTVDLVRELMEHPAFSITNPNRVRSLIGAFASSNQTGFHRADGEGYRFTAQTVLNVEEHNPQVAARLAIAFRSWRSLEKGRQEHAREALSMIARKRGLSRDLNDIIERTLA